MSKVEVEHSFERSNVVGNSRKEKAYYFCGATVKDLPLFYFFLAKEAFLELGGEKAWMSARISETSDSPSLDEIELSRADLKRVKLLQSILGTP